MSLVRILVMTNLVSPNKNKKMLPVFYKNSIPELRPKNSTEGVIFYRFRYDWVLPCQPLPTRRRGHPRRLRCSNSQHLGQDHWHRHRKSPRTQPSTSHFLSFLPPHYLTPVLQVIHSRFEILQFNNGASRRHFFNVMSPAEFWLIAMLGGRKVGLELTTHGSLSFGCLIEAQIESWN